MIKPILQYFQTVSYILNRGPFKTTANKGINNAESNFEKIRDPKIKAKHEELVKAVESENCEAYYYRRQQEITAGCHCELFQHCHICDPEFFNPVKIKRIPLNFKRQRKFK